MMRYFTFALNVFKSRLLLFHQNASAGGKGLTWMFQLLNPTVCHVNDKDFLLYNSLHLLNDKINLEMSIQLLLLLA